MLTPAEFIYEGAWFFEGYHGNRSVCYLRLYQTPEPRPAVAIFTETANNAAGTSITNRIEHLAASVWEFLQKPEKPPIVIEHYPNRGVYNPSTDRWQFPEKFSYIEFKDWPTPTFKKPIWRRTKRNRVERLIGQPLRELQQSN